jgi:hypothetical protein
MPATSKRIGFLSFGAWHPGGGMTHTGGDAVRGATPMKRKRYSSSCSYTFWTNYQN